MKILPRVFLLLFFTTGFYYAASQQLEPENFVIPDSLKDLSFKELKRRYTQSLYGSDQEKIYALSIFESAQVLNDTIAMAWGYHVLSEAESNIKKKEIYVDSVLNLSRKWKSSEFRINAYLNKADILEVKGDLQGALGYLEEALRYIQLNQLNNGEHYKRRIKTRISSLNSNWGDLKLSLELDKAELEHLLSTSNRDQLWYSDYLNALFNVSVGYLDLREIDSVFITTKIGYETGQKIKNPIQAKKFTFLSGIAHYYEGNYKTCIDSLNNSSYAINMEDPGNVVFLHLYKGLSYYKQKKYPLALRSLEITDSIYEATLYEFPELKDLYQTFIAYYKKIGNREKQLEYIDKLLKADSVLIKNYRYVGDNLSKKIDTPIYLAEKNKLLAVANRKKETWIVVAFILGILLFGGGILLYVNLKKQRLYKQRFRALLAKHAKKTEQPKTETLALTSGLSEALANELLLKLEAFEAEKGYLKQHISLAKLAAKLNTNTAYLSKVINGYKQRSFTNYIHDLRIEYLIDILKKYPKYQFYSTEALALEIGYVNARTFARAFYTKTGLYPSWFIKELEKSKAS